jgi:phosphoglycerol transferase MdoB-like AlkP superfamily enzyme
MTNDKKTGEMTSESMFLMGLFAMPICIVFVLLGRYRQGFGAWASLGTFLIVARYRWDLRKHVSFWIAIAVMLLMLTAIVVYVPWEAKWMNDRAFMPLALAYGAIGLGCVRLAEMAIQKKEKSDTKE